MRIQVLFFEQVGMPKVFADDAGVLSKDREDIDVALKKVTKCFASHTAKTAC